MATKIEWTNETWNVVTGCSKISPGCAHCYADRMSKRLAGRCRYPAAPHNFDVTLHPDRLEEPLRWKKPRRVFVVSMGDLFHDDVPDEFIDRVFTVMGRKCPNHTFQVLTKRPERMLEWHKRYCDAMMRGENSPYPNVWLGVTAENQEQADKRIPVLLQTPAAVRFVSVEPMLGPVDLSEWLGITHDEYYGKWTVDERGCISGKWWPDWVICGGETGPGARPMHPDWARSLRDQCQAAGVAYFFKQWGEYKPGFNSYTTPDGITMYKVGKKDAGRLLDGREWNEYPEVGDGD